MKKLLIVGAGGFGREIYHWASHHPDCGRAWRIDGFLDDDITALDGFQYSHGLLETVDEFKPERDHLFVCGIGNPSIKRKVCEKLLAAGAEFLNLIHPSCVVGQNVQLGRGTVLCPGSVITCDCQIGDFVMLNLYSTVGHDVQIGSWSTLSGHCDLTGGVSLGEEVFAGSRVSVLPGMKVGRGAVLGAGSVVTRNVAEGVTVFGNPARPL